jgi:hypothetical protein
VTISYTSLYQYTADRRLDLLRNYGFLCECTRCLKRSGDEDDDDDDDGDGGDGDSDACRCRLEDESPIVATGADATAIADKQGRLDFLYRQIKVGSASALLAFICVLCTLRRTFRFRSISDSVSSHDQYATPFHILQTDYARECAEDVAVVGDGDGGGSGGGGVRMHMTSIKKARVWLKEATGFLSPLHPQCFKVVEFLATTYAQLGKATLALPYAERQLAVME